MRASSSAQPSSGTRGDRNGGRAPRRGTRTAPIRPRTSSADFVRRPNGVYRPSVLRGAPMADTWSNRLRAGVATSGGEVVRWAWHHLRAWGAIGPRSKIAGQFGSFGQGSAITFPYETLVNLSAIHIGRDTIIAPYVTLSAGWSPDDPELPDRAVT